MLLFGTGTGEAATKRVCLFIPGYLVINDTDLFEMTGYDITFPIECFDRAIEYLPMRDMEAIASASCYRKICYEYFNSSLKNVTNNTEEVFY